MDVAIKLSLAGGHAWEFVCDENDPMVIGVVSALPGATVDANLPPDGLVQVENRAGERLYFSRTSLVAVSVRHVPAAPNAPKPGSPALRPPRFLLLPAVLPREASAEAMALPEVEGRGHPAPGVQDVVDPQSLPAAVVDALVAAAARGVAALEVDASGGTHLDIRLIRAGAGAAFALPVGDAADVLLDVLVVLEAPLGLSVRLAGDGSGRGLGLAEGDILLVPPAEAGAAIGAGDPSPSPVILLAGRLIRGERLAAA
ncbi:MAG: hypothetical protein LCH88_12220 [Proteobacteria bacterium]|nr:hypothetical protein [Pseudomonadota bacterium]